MPVKRLLINMAWPMMLSMLIQALYNMVDSIFVAKMNNAGFTALSLVFPIQTLMIAIQAGTGVGINALLSRRLGEGRPEEAGAVASNGFFLYLLSAAAFLCLGLLFGRPFLNSYSDDPAVIEYGVQYLTIVTAFSIGSCMQFAGERVLQATGNAIGPMVIQGVGAVTNLILDPILIFGLFGFPRLEVAGAAIATVIGQLVGMTVSILMVRKNKAVKLKVRSFRPDVRVIREIYQIGLPAIAMQMLFTIMLMGMNKILALFSDVGVFILGVYFKIQSFVYMPVFGLNNGLTPVVSFNYGARSRERVTGLIHFALTIVIAIMTVGTLVFLLFPQALLSFFDANEDILQAGIPAMRLLSLAFVFSGVNIILGAVFQALGSPNLSLIISLLRQIFIMLPLALLLGYLSPDLVWLCFVITEGLCCVLSFLFYRRLYRTKIAHLSPTAYDLVSEKG